MPTPLHNTNFVPLGVNSLPEEKACNASVPDSAVPVLECFSDYAFSQRATEYIDSSEQNSSALEEEIDVSRATTILSSVFEQLDLGPYSSFLGKDEFQKLLHSGLSLSRVPKRVQFASDISRIHEGDSYLQFKDKILMCEPWPEPKVMLRSLMEDGSLPEVVSSLLHELVHRHQIPKSISRTLKAIRYGALPALGGSFALFGSMTFVYGAVAFGALYVTYRYNKSRYTKEEADLRHCVKQIPSEIHANLIERTFALHPYDSFSQETIYADILEQLMPHEYSAYTPPSVNPKKAEKFIQKATELIDALLLLDTPDALLRNAIIFEKADFEECRFPELESLFEEQRRIHNQSSEGCSFEEKISDLAAQREHVLHQTRQRAQVLLKDSLAL